MRDGEANAVQRLGMACRLLRSARRLIEALVGSARREGATWQQIGDQLGVPRQTAHRRHHRRAG